MTTSPKIKVCGLKTENAVQAAVQAGADFLGFVFYPPSPRSLSIEDAKALMGNVPKHVQKVGLFVDPSDEELSVVCDQTPLDMIQLHGVETPQRLAQIKERYGLPVMKAISISAPEDLEQIQRYETVADWLLFDAPPRKGHKNVPGGTGQSFDWSILDGLKISKPWMLAGGLNADNVQEAIDFLRPGGVDVSSGVEITRGVKDPQKITDFIRAVKNNG